MESTTFRLADSTLQPRDSQSRERKRECTSQGEDIASSRRRRSIPLSHVTKPPQTPFDWPTSTTLPKREPLPPIDLLPQDIALYDSLYSTHHPSY